MNKQEQILQLLKQIQKLQKERDNTPSQQFQVIESIMEDINYYQRQIEFLKNEVDT